MSIQIITISRQFGSGGRTIAKQLAERLGYDYYDKEIIDSVAVESGFSKEYIEKRGEEAPGKTTFSYGFESQGVPGIMNGISSLDFIWSIQRQVICNIADSGKPSVIVGRSSNYILRDRDDVLNAYICADLGFRMDRIVCLYGESEVKPEKRINDKDKKRAANHKHYTGENWGLSENYDVCLNSSKLGLDSCVDIIYDIVMKSRK